MKKILALLLAAVLVLSLAACTPKKPAETTAAPDTTADQEDTTAPEETTEEPTVETEEQTDAPVEGAMSYAEFAAAELNSEVTIAAYIQGMQKYAEAYGNTTLYMQDEDGGYFVYRIKMTQEQYDTLELGQRLKITGYKQMWPEENGEVEICDATFEIIDGVYHEFAATDVTAFLGTDELADYMNRRVAFSGMTVAAKGDEGAVFFYKWNGSGEKGDDIYFDLTKDGQTYTFVVESDLCDQDSDVYKAVEALKVGDVIDLEGFLYWYEGMQPHITSVTVK